MVCYAENIAVSRYILYMGYGNVHTITKSRNSIIELEIAFIATTCGLYKPGCPIFIGDHTDFVTF